MFRGARERGRVGDAGVTGKKGGLGGRQIGGREMEKERERAKGRMKEVIYRWWV